MSAQPKVGLSHAPCDLQAAKPLLRQKNEVNAARVPSPYPY
jgi:hypothetical protein